MGSEFKHIAILGVGVIGGSLGLAFKRKLPHIHIMGCSRPETIQEALKSGAIDEGFNRKNPEECLSKADLVFLCAPIHIILNSLPDIASMVKPGAVVTDVGSTKAQIMQKAQASFNKDAFFIGGHPMAGNEGKGVNWADPLLFENAVYVLTPSDNVPQKKTDALNQLLQTIGAKVLILEPELHDKIAAAVSHLPQLIAVTLMNYVAQNRENSDLFLKLAAGGFRDMTRIASSPYTIWEDILDTNSAEIETCLDDFILALSHTKEKMRAGQLNNDFETAAKNRLNIPKDTKGFIRQHFDLSVQIEDKPGVLARITKVLADASINVKDIEILKIREGDAGTLRLSFETQSARQNALELLEQNAFKCRLRN